MAEVNITVLNRQKLTLKGVTVMLRNTGIFYSMWSAGACEQSLFQMKHSHLVHFTSGAQLSPRPGDAWGVGLWEGDG